MLKKNEQLETLLADAHTLDEGKQQIFYKIPDIIQWNSSEHKITLGGAEFGLTDYALRQFLKKLKIPYPYYMQCSPDLRDKEIREAMEEQSGKVEYVFKIKNDKIYGIVPKQYYSTLTEPFLQRVASNLPGNVSIAEYSLDLDKTRVRFMATDKVFVQVDEIVPAVDVSFSEVGACPFNIMSALFRKVCSNGMMIPEGKAPSFKMPMARFRDEQFEASILSMTEMFDHQQDFAELFEKFKTIKLEEPVSVQDEEYPEQFKAAYNLILPSRALQKDFGQLVVEEFNKHEDNKTVNGLMNAVTRTARDITGADKDRLESSVGAFLSKVYSLQKDVELHNEQFDFTLQNIQRLCKRHS